MKFCFYLFVPLALTAPATADEVEPTKPVIAIELKTTTPVVKKGQYPRFTVEIVNRSGREITLVRPGDGSDCGWRTPVVLWAVEGIKPGRLARCGNVNPLRPDEVFTLKPGQRASLGGWVGLPQLPGQAPTPSASGMRTSRG